MRIGIPREIKAQEDRVALVPAGARQLVEDGHEVLVESGAGEGAGFADADYRAAGARLVDTADAVFAGAELLVKVKEPLPEEVARLRPHHLLFTFLHLAASRSLTEGLLASGCTAMAYEMVERDGKLPLLEPMSEIAGRMSALVGAHHLARPQGGRGVLLGGISGVLPARVLVLGGGTAGVSAARMAGGLGAEVVLLEIDPERMRFLDLTLPPNLRTAFSSPATLEELLPTADLVVGAVLVPGAKAPHLVSRSALSLLREGSVVVDIAIDQGGCIETSRPTTHEAPTFVEEGIVHYCVANMPGAYSRTATQGLTNVTLPYLRRLAAEGREGVHSEGSPLRPALSVAEGRLYCRPVAEALGLELASG